MPASSCSVFVALFGAFTVVFGVSTLTWLSIFALAMLGATDMVSVYVRETLIQLWTPDELRGRVNAVNGVFVGASNELGEFRAGTMAALIGTVPAVVFGGVGALAVAGIWAWLFPELRKVDATSEAAPESESRRASGGCTVCPARLSANTSISSLRPLTLW